MRAGVASDGSVAFTDSAGKAAFTIPVGQAIDAAGATTPVSLKLTQSADASTSDLAVSTDPTWLADSARVFPVIIDPTLQQSSGDDAYVANSTADQNINFHGYGQYDFTLGKYVDNVGFKSGEEFRSYQQFDLSGSTFPSGSFSNGELEADWQRVRVRQAPGAEEHLASARARSMSSRYCRQLE